MLPRHHAHPAKSKGLYTINRLLPEYRQKASDQVKGERDLGQSGIKIQGSKFWVQSSPHGRGRQILSGRTYPLSTINSQLKSPTEDTKRNAAIVTAVLYCPAYANF